MMGETGEAFAARHRDSLLSRMIPTQSLAAGRVALPRLVGPGQEANGVNFDMNDPQFRVGEIDPVLWPRKRGSDISWRHSDLRDVALPFVSGLYERLISTSTTAGEP